MASNPRVFIAYSQLLLARAIEAALKSDRTVDIVACERIESDVCEHIAAASPDVVILDRSDIGTTANQSVLELCKENPGLKIIVIDHGENIVDVFRVYYQQVVVSDPSDIVGLVRASFP